MQGPYTTTRYKKKIISGWRDKSMLTKLTLTLARWILCRKQMHCIKFRGGHSHYGSDTDVRLQRPPILSVAVTQRPHIFFFVKCGLFDRSHPKAPCFDFFGFGCHRKFLFVSISLTNWSFLPFSTIFLVSLSVFSHTMPPNFEPKFALSPNDPSLFVFSPNAPAFGSVSLTPVSISYWSAPPPPDQIIGVI